MTRERDYRGHIRSAQGARDSPTTTAGGLEFCLLGFLSGAPVKNRASRLVAQPTNDRRPARVSCESRRDRRHWPDWLEGRRHSASGRPRGDSLPHRSASIRADRLKEAVLGAHVVIDLSNAPSFQLKAMLKFLETSASRLDSVSPTWVMLQRFLRVSCGCGEVRKRGLLKISGEEDSRTGVSEITGLH